MGWFCPAGREARYVAVAATLLVVACGGSSEQTALNIDRELLDTSNATKRDGLAAAILIDVSGSMSERVDAGAGRQERKIDIARRAAQELVNQFARYAADHSGEPVLLGIYEFSERGDQPDARPLMRMGPPMPAAVAAAVARATPEGGTPIGNAMIIGKRELDATGLSRRHLLVITDGENTDGFAPGDVAQAIGRRPDAERPSIYFVAFDIEASRFAGVRDAGGLVLAAANAKELNDTLDGLLRGKILVE